MAQHLLLFIVQLLLLLTSTETAPPSTSMHSESPSSLHPPKQLNGHPLKLDADGNIETWLPNSTAHHDFVDRAMAYVRNLPVDPSNGLRAWLTHGQVPFYNNAHNPASLFGAWAQIAGAFHAYTGDDMWMNQVGIMLEYMLANGTTRGDEDWAYPSVPYASSDPGAVRYRGAADWDDFHVDANPSYNPIGRGDGYGVIEPDKIGLDGRGRVPATLGARPEEVPPLPGRCP